MHATSLAAIIFCLDLFLGIMSVPLVGVDHGLGDHVLATITDHSNRRPMRYADALERYPVQTPNGPVVDMPTVEKPICLHLVGTDDCSYSAFFETVEQAEGMLQNILVFPMWDSLFDFGFVFTN